ncbi:MAG TPA: DEAD/DEAH box helicase, partial [Acidobacteriota bacterium]|nr:DEAD/DEAH box helicase [Acidobacteriota bacterium]
MASGSGPERERRVATRRQGAGGRRAAEAAAAGDMGALVASLASDPKLASFVRHRGLVPGSDPVYAEPASGWPPGAREAALKLGAARLYSHQAAALDLVAAGNNVLLATPTASGKTLAYVLAFLARRALDPAA